NFTGFLSDFVTYGSIDTRLGTLTTDLNMKLPAGRQATYSGSLRTAGFAVGPFIGSDAIGKIVFAGSLKGQGLEAATIDAGFDGTISLLEFRGYPYQGMTVRGNFTNQRFNGSFVSEDPYLQASLDGLVDFSGALPQFDFDAQVTRADLKM